MTFEELRDRLISEGIAEVTKVYAADEDRREGAIEGFELCRSLTTREEFERVIRAREAREFRIKLAHHGEPSGVVVPPPIERTIEQYWRHRYGTLQVEWVLSCLLVAGWARPGEMVSSRAGLKVGELTKDEPL